MTINDLPPEILAEIFVLSIPRFERGQASCREYIVRLRSRFSPLSLVHVCQYWREVALSNQTMWTSFSANEFSPTPLEYWLDFAQKQKLHLALSPWTEFGRPMDDASLKAAKRMLQLFGAYSEQLGSLYLDSPCIKFTEEISNTLRKLSGERTSLCELEIQLSFRDTSQTIIDDLFSAIESVQSVRQLTWFYRSKDISIPHIPLWQKLNVVHVEGPFPVGEAIWCLAHCTSATNVTILCATRSIEFSTPRSPIYKLPNITSLTINNPCQPNIFLQYFTLPSLASLKIFTYRKPSTALEDFFIRSQCPLVRFHVHDNQMSMTDEDIVDCINTPYLLSVPEVRVSIIHTKKRFAGIVEARPNIFQDFPGLGICPSATEYSIGWMKDT